MSARIYRIAAAFIMLAVMLVTTAGAGYAISANVVMKVSRTAQDSIINEGEDLSIDVSFEGIEPASYRWFFGDTAIEGANYPWHTIVSATPADAGTYRVEAFGEGGDMLVSMDFSVRVVEKAMPKSGDDTIDSGIIAGVMAAAGLVLTGAATAKKRRQAA